MSTPTVNMDFETYSEQPITTVGAYRYAEDPSTEVVCLGYCVNDEPVKVWNPYTCPEPPQDLFDALADPNCKVWAWNAQFERLIWQRVCVERMGWPAVARDQWRCSMALAASLGLPLSLDKCGSALKLDIVKDKRGKYLINRLSKPKKPSKKNPNTRWTYEDDTEHYLEFFDYCGQDVESERAIVQALPVKQLNPTEQKVWATDQQINDNGVHVDLPAIRRIIELDDLNRQQLTAHLQTITNKEIMSGDQRNVLMEWCNAHGANLPDLTQPSIHECLAGDLPAVTREVLELRLKLSKKTTAKFKKIMLAVCSDGSVKGCFQYHAARTGRAGGRLIQLQNLNRGLIKDPDAALDAIASGMDLDTVELLYGDYSDVAVSLIRGVMCSRPNHQLFVSDYSAIEARVVAWVAGEEKVLEVFRTHGKIYEQAAAGIYHVPIGEVTKDQRFIGKVAILALGFQGGVNAFIRMALNYGVEISEDEALDIVRKWRKANPKIKKLWYDVEKAAVRAVKYPGKLFHVANVTYFMDPKSKFLFCKLPSGRLISYPQVYLKETMTPYGKVKEQLHCHIMEDGRWSVEKTYGGRLVENIVQAIARDLMMQAQINVTEAGYNIVLHIHDEIGADVPDGFGSLRHFEQLMCILPDWAEGLPIDAEGFIAKRYKKG